MQRRQRAFGPAFAFPDQAARSRDAQARGAGLSRAGRCAIYWTHNSDLIGFRIDDAADGTSLYSFWLGFEPI
ncbi:hypothetical protein BBK14_15605 [Parafrankia soli]|uniref:Uncharacterized protein n=1 Tax=Parafrankia soli TaxID=2599596 RepID=A0A1S1QGY7_9ACTN|nr:hypothetical protein BBK14_15605 [Parafrankia soli]